MYGTHLLSASRVQQLTLLLCLHAVVIVAATFPAAAGSAAVSIHESVLHAGRANTLYLTVTLLTGSIPRMSTIRKDLVCCQILRTVEATMGTQDLGDHDWYEEIFHDGKDRI